MYKKNNKIEYLKILQLNKSNYVIIFFYNKINSYHD